MLIEHLNEEVKQKDSELQKKIQSEKQLTETA